MTLATIPTSQICSLPVSVHVEPVQSPGSLTPSPLCRILFNKSSLNPLICHHNGNYYTLSGVNRVLAIIAPNDNFQIESENETIWMLSLNTDLPGYEIRVFHSTVLIDRDNLLDEVVSQIVSANPGQRNTNRLVGLTKTILSIIECRYSKPGKPMFAPKGKLSPEQMHKLLKLVSGSIHSDLSLSTLAAEVHLSEFHFSRLFRNTFGTSPYQFVLQSKIECAQEIMKQYPKSLSQIAHSLNFTDQAHFTNVFKKITGVPPTTYIASMTGRQRLLRP